MNDRHINVTLLMGTRSVDLRVPLEITVYQLVEELSDIFSENLLRPKIQLKIINKGLLLNEKDKLSEFPAASGDIIQILEV